MPLAYVAGRAGTTYRVVVPVRQSGNRFLGLLTGSTNTGSGKTVQTELSIYLRNVSNECAEQVENDDE
jgi:hypothetical protein